MLAKIKGKRGFTLVELMIVVAIIGVLAALAIYGVRKYVANSKTTEAREMLGRIAGDAAGAYNGEKMDGTVLSAGGTSDISQRLCGSATNSVPSAVGNVAAKKYQSASSEWAMGDQVTGWRCLKFGIDGAQYYMYQYSATNPTASNGTFSAIAVGNLNGDTTYSTFEMQGALQNGSVAISPKAIETNPEE